MSINYRKLTEKDLDSFIRLRIAQLREEGATEDIDLTPALLDYYLRHLADECRIVDPSEKRGADHQSGYYLTDYLGNLQLSGTDAEQLGKYDYDRE